MSNPNPNGLNMGASTDQIRMAAINGGATVEGSKLVAEICAENPELDLQEVIKEVAGSSKGNKKEIADKLNKKAEEDAKKAKPQAAVIHSNAPQPGTPEYNNLKEKK